LEAAPPSAAGAVGTSAQANGVAWAAPGRMHVEPRRWYRGRPRCVRPRARPVPPVPGHARHVRGVQWQDCVRAHARLQVRALWHPRA
jgi:hypothetical protein